MRRRSVEDNLRAFERAGHKARTNSLAIDEKRKFTSENQVQGDTDDGQVTIFLPKSPLRIVHNLITIPDPKEGSLLTEVDCSNADAYQYVP